ncbi:MAG: hypothetical protein GY856_40060 [bacterium]|nr:hypothetical protein [bacterium]
MRKRPVTITPEEIGPTDPVLPPSAGWMVQGAVEVRERGISTGPADRERGGAWCQALPPKAT